MAAGGPPPAGELDRAFDFLHRADMAGTRREPSRSGAAVLMPERPLRRDSDRLPGFRSE